MRAVDVIEKKRDGLVLTDEEIQWFIKAYTDDAIPDYQAAAFCMAVMLRGMTTDEVTALTLAMAHSGDMLDLSAVSGYVVDKHSSGGVGDKTSLVVLPLVAAAGVPVAKMSGRGLGLSGGTLDKMESITGFDVNMSEAQLIQQAQTIGLSLAGQTRELAPADGKLYALRDVTGTVPSLPLIASSIMSKKLAAGAQGIVLDVKVGLGAFMRELDQAKELAQIMVNIGKNAGRDMVALISDMNQPLGNAVGNALEVREAIETMQGGGPADFREHCLEVAAYMLLLAGQGDKWQDVQANEVELAAMLENGVALAKFREMVEAQGGDVSQVDNLDTLPQAELVETLTADNSGYVAQVAADKVAMAAAVLGAGREKKEDIINPAVGVVVQCVVGDSVAAGAPLAIIHADDADKLAEARAHLHDAFVLNNDEPIDPLPLFYEIIR